jgi:hypothetical protein
VRSPRPAANANFRRYFIGQSASLLGDQISLIALPLTAVLALSSAGQMGVLTTVYLIPNPALLTAPACGSTVAGDAGRRWLPRTSPARC